MRHDFMDAARLWQRGRGSKHLSEGRRYHDAGRRPPCEGVDRNVDKKPEGTRSPSVALVRGVDRNSLWSEPALARARRPL
jgi:hypothetical protein